MRPDAAWPGLRDGVSIIQLLAFQGPSRVPPPSVRTTPNCTEFREYYKQLLDIYLAAIDMCSKLRDDLRDFEDIPPGGRRDTPCAWIAEEIQRLETTEGVRIPPPPGYGERLGALNHQYGICAGSKVARTPEELYEAEAAGRAYRSNYLRDQVRRCNLYLQLLEDTLDALENRFRDYGCSGSLY